MDNEVKQLADRISSLESWKTKIGGNTGGVLSGGDIRTRIICKDEQDKYLKIFEERKWDEIRNTRWQATSNSGNNTPEATKRFVIKEYDELNVTPFSYDLSLGQEIFSIQKPKGGVKPLTSYSLEPGETVVVITNEKVAIPHAYSATVWPRFNMVKQGVFQSMVKIDPTWYGHLAIAMSNLSPAKVILNRNEAFATLLFYELSEESDIDLWKLKDLQKSGIAVTENIPEEFNGDISKIDKYIFDNKKLRGYCRVRGKTLAAWGIKREQVEELKECLSDERWYNFVNRLTDKWTKLISQDTKKRIIVMNAIGMTTLNEMVQGFSEQGYLDEKKILELAIDDNSLVEAAVKYGKPFDQFARIPDTIIKRIQNETIPKIEAEIQSNIQTRVIVLVFSIFGFVSLVLTILTMLWRLGGNDFLRNFSNWDGLWAAVTIVGAIFGLGFLFVAKSWLVSVKKGLSRDQSRVNEQAVEIEKKKDELVKKSEELEKEKESISRNFKKWRRKQAESVKRFRKYVNKNCK